MTPPLKPVPALAPGEYSTARGLARVAASQVGYREGYGNDNAYGVAYGMNHVAWCAQFVTWAARRAGISSSVIPTYAYTPSGKSFFDARGRTYRTGQAGDIGFVYFPSMGRIGHTFIVESSYVTSQGVRLYRTLEGNTNDSGSSQGIGVFRLLRAQSGNLYFGRPAYTASSTPTAPTPPAQPEDWFDMATEAQLKQIVRDTVRSEIEFGVPRAIHSALTGDTNQLIKNPAVAAGSRDWDLGKGPFGPFMEGIVGSGDFARLIADTVSRVVQAWFAGQPNAMYSATAVADLQERLREGLFGEILDAQNRTAPPEQ